MVLDSERGENDYWSHDNDIYSFCFFVYKFSTRKNDVVRYI